MTDSTRDEMPAGTAPATLYAARRQSLEGEARRLRARHVLLSYLRLAWAVAIVALAWFVFARHALPWEWFLLPCVGFGVTARWHAKVLAAGSRSERAAAWNASGMGRVEDRWAGQRPRAPEVDASGSLYASDLDLFSAGGLFELLSTARTSLGETVLAQWLLQPAAIPAVRERQRAVAELRDKTELREAVASVPGAPLVKVDERTLAAWGAEPRAALPEALFWIVALLAMLTLAAAVRWAISRSPLLLLLSVATNWGLTSYLQPRLKPLFSAAGQASFGLSSVAELLELLEQESFHSPQLQELRARLTKTNGTASAAIRRLATLNGALEQRSNWLLRIVDLLVNYSILLGLLVQRWRTVHGPQLGAWLLTLGELEALLSLSAYHFEHPEDVFPELVEAEPLFAAEALGHPLLARAACIRNSVTLNRETKLVLVSGSNMSGKSTLLRSVGTAAVMAMTGAPVRARRLRLGPLHVAASIQVNDSLQGGRSRFFAEILRLRAICELARTASPVLFLLDELLAGTNSQDRLAGARGVIESLLASDAIGLLSTHDLALTATAAGESSALHNVHFEDQVEADRLAFDYILREGVVTRSNGLALMRLIGLHV